MNGKRARRERQHNRQPQGSPFQWPQMAVAGAEAEAASTRDRLWFQLHPDHTRYLRKRIPGEFGPREREVGPGAHYTLVTRLNFPGGGRTRAPWQVTEDGEYLPMAELADAVRNGVVFFTPDGEVIDGIDPSES